MLTINDQTVGLDAQDTLEQTAASFLCNIQEGFDHDLLILSHVEE